MIKPGVQLLKCYLKTFCFNDSTWCATVEKFEAIYSSNVIMQFQ